MMQKLPRERTAVFEPGLDYMFIPTQGDFSFLFIAVDRLPREKPGEMLDRFHQVLLDFGAGLFVHWVFGGFHPERARTERATIQHWFKDHNYQAPIWLCGDGAISPKMSAIQAIAVVQKSPRMALSLAGNGSAYTRFFSDAFATYSLWCGNPKFSKDAVSKNRDSITAQIFEDSEAFAKPVRTECYKNVARTWIYLDHLLQWYTPFNQIRTTFFEKRGLFQAQTIPSSTGIGAANIASNPMSLTTLSVVPKSAKVSVHAVASPLQCPANDYQSSFSRAHMIEHPHFKWLMISGTASIAPEGETEHVGDIDKQIDLTMRVVKAIMDEQDMTWMDVARMIVYVKDPKYTKNFVQWCVEHELPEFPASWLHCDICRDDLLMEVELDVVRAL